VFGLEAVFDAGVEFAADGPVLAGAGADLAGDDEGGGAEFVQAEELEVVAHQRAPLRFGAHLFGDVGEHGGDVMEVFLVGDLD